MPVRRFAEFEFDLSARELRSPERTIRLQEQPALVLDLLLGKAGTVVTREELHRKLWPAKVYFDLDHGLNNCIGKLREALGETREQPRFLETIPRVGYRFTVDILPLPAESSGGIESPAVTLPEAPAATSRAAGSRRSNAARSGMLIAVAIVFAAGIWLASRNSHEGTVIRSIAVLPFENESAQAGQDYLVDGLTDTLITDLANIGHLNVISRTTAMHY
jgi:DNA-binding winged helix-turn-helix (wHTH) protein